MTKEIVIVEGVRTPIGNFGGALKDVTAHKLGDYIAQCKANGGAVTINLGIYQDGTVDPNAVEVLKEVRKRVR